MPDYIPPDFSKLDPKNKSLAAFYEKFPEWVPQLEQAMGNPDALDKLHHGFRLNQEHYLKKGNTEEAERQRQAASEVMKIYAKKWGNRMEPDLDGIEAREAYTKVANSINASEKITDLADPRYVDPKQVDRKAHFGDMMGFRVPMSHPMEGKVAELLKTYLTAIPMRPPVTR